MQIQKTKADKETLLALRNKTELRYNIKEVFRGPYLFFTLASALKVQVHWETLETCGNHVCDYKWLLRSADFTLQNQPDTVTLYRELDNTKVNTLIQI